MSHDNFIPDWKYANADKVKEQQIKETAKLPFSKKLEWLEQMQEIVDFLNTDKVKKII